MERETAALFQLLEMPDTGGVTALRRETKFALPHCDLGKIRSLLDMNCRPVTHAGPVSVVRSIYFDDVRMSGCSENIEGIGRRTKVRLRWYDSLFPTWDVHFEVKRRRASLTSKERFRLQLATPLATLSYRRMVNALARALPDETGELLRARPRPIVLIAYRRRHYATRDGAARVTLDEGVRCFDQTGHACPHQTFGRNLEGLVIVEVKTPPGAEETVARLLHPLKLRVTKSSKYVQCCQALGAVTGTQVACLR